MQKTIALVLAFSLVAPSLNAHKPQPKPKKAVWISADNRSFDKIGTQDVADEIKKHLAKDAQCKLTYGMRNLHGVLCRSEQGWRELDAKKRAIAKNQFIENFGKRYSLSFSDGVRTTQPQEKERQKKAVKKSTQRKPPSSEYGAVSAAFSGGDRDMRNSVNASPSRRRSLSSNGYAAQLSSFKGRAPQPKKAASKSPNIFESFFSAIGSFFSGIGNAIASLFSSSPASASPVQNAGAAALPTSRIAPGNRLLKAPTPAKQPVKNVSSRPQAKLPDYGGTPKTRSLPKTSLSAATAGGLKLYNRNTKQTVTIGFSGGRINSADQKKLDDIMRDKSGRAGKMSPKLVSILLQIQNHFGGKTVEIISGYRSPEYNKQLIAASKKRNGGKSGVAKYSRHMHGDAADIVVKGVSVAALHKYALSMKAGGVGKYAGWVHVDAGRVRRW